MVGVDADDPCWFLLCLLVNPLWGHLRYCLARLGVMINYKREQNDELEMVMNDTGDDEAHM